MLVSGFQYSPDSTQRVLGQLQLVRGAAPRAGVLLRGLQQLQHPDDVVLSRYSTLSVEHELKAIRRFAKVSIVSYIRPSLMIIASRTQSTYRGVNVCFA